MLVIKSRSLFFKQRQNHNFLSSLLNANKSNLHQIYQHPFNQQLFKGTLPPETFGCYLRDDYFYLRQFSSTLQKLAKQTVIVDNDLANKLNYLAKDIIDNELKMQQQYEVYLQNKADYLPSHTISSYAEYLAITALNSELPIALSAVLPCFWIYHQLGIMHGSTTYLSNNPYKNWITTYSSTEFIAATQHLAKTVNLLGNKSTPIEQSKMKNGFKIAVQFELDFFDSVCSKESSLKLIT